MPTYEYECRACGHAFEELQGMTDAKLIKCPKCHKNKLSRLIGSGSGMIFKGSGFYETDYKKKPLNGPGHSIKSDQVRSDGLKPAPAAPCGGGCACHPH
jgi:putative FmdB family regulatory protein